MNLYKIKDNKNVVRYVVASGPTIACHLWSTTPRGKVGTLGTLELVSESVIVQTLDDQVILGKLDDPPSGDRKKAYCRECAAPLPPHNKTAAPGEAACASCNSPVAVS